jgi:hypothetical protein
MLHLRTDMLVFFVGAWFERVAGRKQAQAPTGVEPRMYPSSRGMLGHVCSNQYFKLLPLPLAPDSSCDAGIELHGCTEVPPQMLSEALQLARKQFKHIMDTAAVR